MQRGDRRKNVYRAKTKGEKTGDDEDRDDTREKWDEEDRKLEKMHKPCIKWA